VCAFYSSFCEMMSVIAIFQQLVTPLEVLGAHFLVKFEFIITIQLVPSFETSNMARYLVGDSILPVSLCWIVCPSDDFSERVHLQVSPSRLPCVTPLLPWLVNSVSVYIPLSAS
jgi:hypothetical protein